MDFDTLLAQITDLLRRQGRVSYGALQRRFNLDDDYVQDLKDELIGAQRLAVDEDGKILVWAGPSSLEFSVQSRESEEPGRVPTAQTLDPRRQTLDAVAERRQLTVMFCDLVGSTVLSTQLDPEDLREVVRQYQQTCAGIITQHEGSIAQYLGDGLLVYFGYPTAHEDDARRAVRAGLEIIAAIAKPVSFPLVGEGQGEGRGEGRLQVRLGIHTGLVVVGEIGGGSRHEHLALGETPNIAARLQGLAEPNTVLISAATQRLVGEQFECQPFGSHLVKGIDTPIAIYHVQSERQSVSPLAGKATLTPLMGREQEVGLLLDRWEQVKEGHGQVVLLSGEPGIGKSRLAYTLREHVTAEGSLLFEARGSPYHQHSALYPLIESLQRTLLLTRQDTDDEKVTKLERALTLYAMQENLPLFTALLSLPTPPGYPPLTFTPQKQKERTLQALLQLLVVQAERQATVLVWEDLHWADPSSLEFLTLLIEQVPTTKLLLVLTFRPEFIPPWKPRSHISQLVLNRLGKRQVEAMIEKVAAGRGLSADIIDQIRIKTDGVPLFVEELTKSVVESVGAIHESPLQLAIPATLQEALLARLDRLSTARQVAQLGATLGREFSYELLHAVAPISEADLQTSLAKLVEAEILYQRRVGEQARYFFKHALIQDTAYQSLLKSTRQQYHQQIARVLEERFPDSKASQPELLAHHYTEAGLIEQAISYWQRAGERATQRSANAEAIGHLTSALDLLKILPDSLHRNQREIDLQMALGPVLIAAKGYASLEATAAYTRAQELCQQIDANPRLYPVLWGLWASHALRGEYKNAHTTGKHLLTIAQEAQDLSLLLEAHAALGVTLFWMGEPGSARKALEQGISLYDPQQHRSHAFIYGQDPAVICLSYLAWVLWVLGHQDQAHERIQELLSLAPKILHPFSTGMTLNHTAWFYLHRREWELVYKFAEDAITLATTHGFPFWLAEGTILRGRALSERGQERDGIDQIREGLTAYRETIAELGATNWLALLGEVYGKMGQLEKGISSLAEALTLVDKTGERFYEAELYRLKGELTLQLKVESRKSKVQEAEEYLFKAIEISRKQQAKSLELRAAMSLARLWQQQSKKDEARQMLADIYNWFTEGFDTKDLQEAKALLEELSHSTSES